MTLLCARIATFTILSVCGLSSAANGAAPARCKNVPGDIGWPTMVQWSILNVTLSGRLIKTIPIGSPCYEKTINVATSEDDLPTYDEATCSHIREDWNTPTLHYESPSSVMQTYFANNSCNPINVQGDCGIGSYVQYAINVTSDEDALAGIEFAQTHNIRLLVRNTGHEYMDHHRK